MKKWRLIPIFFAYPSLVFVFFSIAESSEFTFLEMFEGICYVYGIAFVCSSVVLWVLVGLFMAAMWIWCFMEYSRMSFLFANIGSVLFFILPIVLSMTGVIPYCVE